MLRQQQPIRLVVLRYPDTGVGEGLEHRDAAVLVHVGGGLAAGEGVDEVTSEQRRVPLAAATGRRHHEPVGAGQGLDERSARARGVDERDAPAVEAVEQLRIVVDRQVAARQVDAGRAAHAAVSEQHDDDVVAARGPLGERVDGRRDVLARGAVGDALRIDLRVLAQVGDPLRRQVVARRRRLDQCRGPRVELLPVGRIPAEPHHDQQVRLLRAGVRRRTEQERRRNEGGPHASPRKRR